MPEIVGGEVFWGRTSLVVVTTSCGAVAEPASRLLKAKPVESDVASAKLTSPFPATRGVTSRLTHCRDANAPTEDVAADAGAGAFAYVIVVSPQVLSDTPKTLTPTEEAEKEFTRRLAETTVPVRPCTLKRR